MNADAPDHPQRRRPAHGVYVSLSQPTIVFLSVCTVDRNPWLASPKVQAALETVWREADAWLVGHYLLMPEHLHLFCAPQRLEFSLKAWVTCWKRAFSRLQVAVTDAWQRDYWDTRLRREEHYADKWEYVRQNPVRRGLVQRPEDWPFQGTLNVLRW